MILLFGFEMLFTVQKSIFENITDFLYNTVILTLKDGYSHRIRNH